MKKLSTSLVFCFFAILGFGQTACNVPVIGIAGVECTLLYDTQNGITLTPCGWPAGVPFFEVGDQLVISYTSMFCITFCQQGPTVNVTCATYSNRPSSIETPADVAPLSVYPQPASSQIVYTHEQVVDKISIYNPFGKILETHSGLTGNTLDVSTLGTGFYLFHFEGEGFSEVKKVSIVK